MAGQIKRMLDTLVQQRAKGNEALVNVTKTKLILKGLDPDRYTATSPDDAALMEKVRAIALEMGVRV